MAQLWPWMLKNDEGGVTIEFAETLDAAMDQAGLGWRSPAPEPALEALPVRDERGMVAAMVLGLMATFFLVVGLVHDGGVLLAARQRAYAVAESAARAAAQHLDEEAVRGGLVALDQAAARAAALDYIAAEGSASDPVVDVEADSATVALSVSRPLAILGALVPDTVRAEASARAARGLRGPE